MKHRRPSALFGHGCRVGGWALLMTAGLGAELFRFPTANHALYEPKGDARFLDILTSMGCQAIRDDLITVTCSERLRGGTFDCNATPDLVPTLAAIAPLAQSPVEIVNVANLRVKESDRLATVTQELQRLGARVEERANAVRIEPGWGSGEAVIDTHNDHRIAMAFAVAGLRSADGIVLDDPACVDVSFPGFFERVRALGGVVEAA